MGREHLPLSSAMKVSFAVCVTHPNREEEVSFYESVLDAVEDYHSSVLKSALQGWDCVVLSLCINGQPVEVLESIELFKNGRSS